MTTVKNDHSVGIFQRKYLNMRKSFLNLTKNKNSHFNNIIENSNTKFLDAQVYRRLSFMDWGGLSFGLREEPNWRDVVSDAERLVGYPTSFLNLRWLFNDEIANTAIHLRKLVCFFVC